MLDTDFKGLLKQNFPQQNLADTEGGTKSELVQSKKGSRFRPRHQCCEMLIYIMLSTMTKTGWNSSFTRVRLFLSPRGWSWCTRRPCILLFFLRCRPREQHEDAAPTLFSSHANDTYWAAILINFFKS